MTNAAFSTWMGELPQRLTNVPLGHLAIPGSHNSFSAALDASQGVAIDQPETIRKLGQSCCGAATGFIRKWSVTQRMSMFDQLQAGIRYFDLRICKKPDTDEFHFLHGLYGDCVKDGLEAMKPFFKEYPSEVVILDMNHFYNMAPSDHDLLLGQIVDTIGDLLVPVNGYQYKLWSLTLANVWNHPGRIILIYHNPFNAASFPTIWNKTVINSPWPNTDNVQNLIHFLEAYYSSRKRSPGYGFHVWQGCLTPKTSTILRNVFGSLESPTNSATSAFARWLKDTAPGESRINICLADFVENPDFVPAVLAVNNTKSFDTKEEIYGTYCTVVQKT